MSRPKRRFGRLGVFSSLLLVIACAHNAPAKSADDVPVSAPPVTPAQNPWSHVAEPAPGPAASVGDYAAGCVQGATVLPATGTGYQVMRPSRHRAFGHPDLVSFIQDFAKQVHDAKFGDLLIGDMGQPRGGPTLSGHASHQTGLDVDIWFYQTPPGKILSRRDRDTFSAPTMVVPEFEGLTKNWKPNKIDILRLAAEHKEVQRIFVNPVIKREICKSFKGQDWLSKLRPWWFHEEHFHVRLFCHAGDSDCETQEPVPPGDGCDSSLDEWFTQSSKNKEKDMREHPSPAVFPKLPQLCEKVLKE